jgi:VanZ family protein
MLIISLASTDAMSSEHTSRFIIPFLHWLKPDISPAAIDKIHFLMRKAAHLTEYAILAALLWRALDHGGKRRWSEQVLTFLCAASFAALDEFHQSFVPSRGASKYDVMIDSCGALIGLLIRWSIVRKRSATALPPPPVLVSSERGTR